MKRLKFLGLAAAVWGVSVMPSASWGDNNFGTHSGRSSGGSGGRAGPAVVSSGFVGSRSAVPGVVTGYRNGVITNAREPVLLPNGQLAVGQRLNGHSDDRFDGRSDRRFDRRSNRRCNNNNDNNNGGGTVVIYPDWNNGYPVPYPTLDYSVNTPSPQSASPFNIALNDGTNLSPLDSGYSGPAMPDQAYPMPGPAPVMPQNPAMAARRPVDTDLVVGVQRELRRRGYYNGVVNGISDSATRAAIRSYEASIGLPVSGQIGTMLLRTLGFM